MIFADKYCKKMIIALVFFYLCITILLWHWRMPRRLPEEYKSPLLIYEYKPLFQPEIADAG